MGKRKNKKRSNPPRRQTKDNIEDSQRRKSLRKKVKSLILWLATIGALPYIGNFTLDLLTGDVEVMYIRPAGRGYEFKLINNNLTDQIIEKFRIAPDTEQGLMVKINKSVYASVSDDGINLPGGNTSYMPAFEYREMNGYILPAKSEVKFRIPPLISRDYMTPESIVVYADYSTKSKNRFMAQIENIFTALKLRDTNKMKKYLVVENYWTPLGQNIDVNAIKNACRDDDQLAKSTICKF